MAGLTKAELLEEAEALGLDVTDENTKLEIEAALTAAQPAEPEKAPAAEKASTKAKTNARGQALCPICGRVRNHVHASEVAG